MSPRTLRTRLLASALTAAAVTGAVLSATPASASNAIIPTPSVQLVDNRPVVEGVIGEFVFQVDQHDFPVRVHAEPGDLRITDEDGTELCTVSAADFERDDCQVRGLGPGNHQITATVANRWGTVSSAPVTLESYAPPLPARSVEREASAPVAVSSIRTSPLMGGYAAITLRTTPGAHPTSVVIRDDRRGLAGGVVDGEKTFFARGIGSGTTVLTVTVDSKTVLQFPVTV
ncbi:hypothetical protein [Curtobacterium sp. PsM8]|uniref:hypothetical protein n=1 Tax=Curtobacterium sp. PsM8 TaxID=3030532 RepID=UPI00263B1255|nr:hypothetical protein [Curtobacterium sp. PsM8]MDN4648407.1 hypothetical protein [Curtobacterium sp. PsM8]